ncbi:helix-turn-helix domain-containing protein [Nocardia donostiensis]|uniref:helix-turn-helix domain-containing protein n=1 Tax=Nocardia donostiensis TaxID=1538463 RepID=UPI0020CA7AA3|nr:helix-turn-helix transcriptional regulator [Nocardia donostiensis]
MNKHADWEGICAMVDFSTARVRCKRCGATTPAGRCLQCADADLMPPLPEHAWWSGDLRQALDARDIGKAIRAYRHHPHHGRRRITQEEMARWLSITQGHLSRIEQGRVPVTNLDTLTQFARLLAVPPSLLWFDLPPDRPTSPVPTRPRTSTALPEELAAAILAPTHPQLSDALLVTLAGHSARDQISGPHNVIEAARQDLAFIEQRMVDSSDNGRGCHRLQYVAGRFAELLGWLYQDAGDLAAAEHWSRIAREYAERIDDTQFRAYALMRSSNIATDAGNLSDATDFIRAALLGSDRLTPRQRAVLHRQQANVHAVRAKRSGYRSDVTACIDALARAAEAAAEPNDEPDELAGYCSPAYVTMEAAHCWIQLGQPDKALTLLEQRLSDWSTDGRRDLGMGIARLSTAYAGVGSWAEAVEVAGYAATIVADTGSYRTLGQLDATATVLRAAGQTSAARELTHQLRAMQHIRTSHGRSFEWS